MVTVLKLGGSVVTEKDTPETVDDTAIERAADAIAQARTDEDPLVVVHGGGSFGHHHAAHHGVSTTEGTHEGKAVTAIHRAMGELNDAIVDALHAQGIEAIPVRPLSVASRTDDQLRFPSQQIELLLEEQFVPVTHGDVVGTEGKGATILSGDEIVVSLARQLDSDRVGVCSTVPGVLDADDEVIETVHSYDDVAAVLGESDATDVTGGMAGKIRELLALNVAASVFDLDSLETFLQTGTAGTVVHGGDQTDSM